MRTLVLTPDFPPAPGGIQLLAHRIASLAPGLECRVVTLDVAGAAAVDGESGVEVRRLRLPVVPRPLAMTALNAAALAQAAEFEPQAVLSAHIVMSPAAAVIRRRHRVPVVQYFHGKEIGVRPRLAGFAARQADASIVVSRYTSGLVEAAGGDLDRVHRIPPGVDVPPDPGRPERSDPPTVVTVARMEDRYKGHDVMVRAMSLVSSRVPGARWVVIGDGPLRPVIAELARASGLGEDVIRFLGAVGNAERDEWLRRAHVFAMPSRLPAGGYAGEGFGIVYLEANAHGLPTVAGAVGGAVDAVVDGETGLLVDPEDHVAVGNALIDLLRDEPRRRRMGAAGAARAADFAWPSIAARVAALVESLGRPGAS